MAAMTLSDDDYAAQQDQQDPLREFRSMFHIPTRGQLRRTTLQGSIEPIKVSDIEPSTYLCGNSLGLQPKLVSQYTAAYHETWATKGVYGHFKPLSDSPLPPWLHVDDDVTTDMAALLGAQRDEIAVMQTLTANIHFALASFYRPTQARHKIIIEGKAFPSDHFAIASQIAHHGFDPATSLITIDPRAGSDVLTTADILAAIDAHADSAAVLHLPAIQYYTGQLFDIHRITAHAQAHGIVVGWDLAHAAGNVPLALHDDNADYAVWCSYKYLNCGPGSIGGLFIHARHGDAGTPRLSGWWGSSKTSRFAMGTRFEAVPGAAGWQLSNPSVADLTALRASLDVFKRTSMRELRQKSVAMTGWLEKLLDGVKKRTGRFEIITPRNVDERGAQLSLKLEPGLLEGVMETLEEEGVVVDERRPDVVRVAPAPLYNSFADCLRFVRVFEAALSAHDGKGGTMVQGGKNEKGWSQVV